MGENLLVSLRRHTASCHLVIVVMGASSRLFQHASRLLRCVRPIRALATKLLTRLCHIILTLLNAILHGDELGWLNRGKLGGGGSPLTHLDLRLLVHHLLTILCVSYLALGCCFRIIKVALVLWSRVVHLHRLWPLLLGDVGRTWELCVECLLQGLD